MNVVNLIGLPLAILAACCAGVVIGLAFSALAYWRLLRDVTETVADRCARDPDCIRIEPPAVHCDRGLPSSWRKRP